MAPSTMQSYERGIRSFYEYHSQIKTSPSWPFLTHEICNFVVYLFTLKLSQATIKAYLSGIGFFHKIYGFDDPTQNFLVKKLLEGVVRSNGRHKDTRLPITRPILKMAIRSLAVVCHSKYEETLFKSAFSLAFHGLLRIGELANSNGEKRHVLQTSDISFEGNTLKVHLHSSKTDQLGQGSLIKLQPQNDSEICPCVLIKDYILCRPINPGPLFCHFNGSAITRYQFVSVLKKALSACGVDTRRYSSHSLRIGMASTLAKEGVPESRIMELGRWKSGAYKNYLRL